MIKVGKYTAALLLMTVGTLLLIDLSAGTEYLGKIVRFWPVVLIGLGVEYLIFGSIYRDPEKRVGLAFGSLMLAIILSIGVVGFTKASNFSFLSDFNINIGSIGFSEKDSIKFEQGITKATIGSQTSKIYLKNPNGQVEFKSGDISEIEIEVTIFVPKSKRDEADEIVRNSRISVNQNGSTLELIAEGKAYKVFGFNQKPRMNLVVTVPRDRELDYEADLINGKIIAADLAVSKLFKADTTNGAIQISRLNADVIADTTNGSIAIDHVNGDVKANTTNGSVTITDIEGSASADTTNGKIAFERVSGKVTADTTNGAITINGVRAGVHADTTNGAITVRSDHVGGDWKLDTTNGAIEVYVPTDASFSVKGDTIRNRTIKSDFPLQISGGKISGSVNGGQYKISVDTNSAISVYKY